jgi:hypothetical protein
MRASETIEKPERTNKLLPLASNHNPDALFIRSEVEVYSAFIEHGQIGAAPGRCLALL